MKKIEDLLEKEKPIDTRNIGVKLDKVEELPQLALVDITVEEGASLLLGKGKKLFHNYADDRKHVL
jgi:hypothetical protein